MREPNAVVQLTSAELAEGTIKPITLPGEGGIEHAVQIRIPPGLADGTLLRIPALEGDHHVRIALEAMPPPSAPPTPPPGFAAAPTVTFGPSARTRRRIVLFSGVAAAVVVIVVTLVAATSGPAGSRTPATTQQAGPPAVTTTTQPPESAADYQQALTALATVLNNGLAELNNAQTPEAISAAVTDLSNGIQQAQGAFSAAPTNAKTANDELVTALQAITGPGLTAVSGAVSMDQICLGSAATALFSRAPSIDQLRQAITTLTSGGLGYQFAVSLPPVTQDSSRTVDTGTIVAGGVKHGLGQLTITNSGYNDATVALVAGQGAPLVTVYIGQDATYTLHQVPDGTYTVYTTSGTDWDAGARLFSRDCRFQQFDQTVDFTTTSTQYTTYTLTLNAVDGGNTSANDVDPGAFPH